jgi:hypothetical protein
MTENFPLCGYRAKIHQPRIIVTDDHGNMLALTLMFKLEMGNNGLPNLVPDWEPILRAIEEAELESFGRARP